MNTSSLNESLSNITNFDYLSSCGVNNCPSTIIPNSQASPTIYSVYILYGVLLFLCLFSGLIVIIFMDDIKEFRSISKINICQRFGKEFLSLIKTYAKLETWLLFPLTFYR